MKPINQLPSNKVISGEIFDASGHTDFMGSLDEAMQIIMDNVKNAGKWAYVNGNPFIFQNFDAAEEAQVKALLTDADEPHFLLTGKLQGGALVAGSRKAIAAGAKAAATRIRNKAAADAARLRPTATAVRTVVKPIATKSVTKYIGKITKRPISQELGTNVAQLAVSLRKGVVEIIVSDYAGGRAKLQAHQNQILAGIFNALRPESDLKADAAKNAVKR